MILACVKLTQIQPVHALICHMVGKDALPFCPSPAAVKELDPRIKRVGELAQERGPCTPSAQHTRANLVVCVGGAQVSPPEGMRIGEFTTIPPTLYAPLQ